ncbi:MAG: dihydroorotate dehydrogenase electron transfer subunit [Gammaproteobacteria bacterium]|nr:dihydroorotate dehydrogenase electron transfer subunit [Gammaproteobacteria bacterium]
MKSSTHRNTIFPEQAEILEHQPFEGEQYVLKVQAPKCAETARPGSFAHIQVDPARLMRRPVSIMRTSPGEGWVEFLYKVVGTGTRLLATQKKGSTLSMLAPIGNPFQLHDQRPRPLLIGGGVGMPPMIFLSQQLAGDERFHPLVILGSEVPFPFHPQPSRMLIPSIPGDVIACMPLLEDWGIPNRLASLQGFAGCHQGYVTDLARHWLQTLDSNVLAEVEILSCGPHIMLESVAQLAREFDLPCQVSLEEYMACGVGGCAGCVVPLNTNEGKAMKRVCVDGPVFDAGEVFG